MEEHITQPTLPGTDGNVPAADGSGAGSDNADKIVSVKDLMKQATGKDFESDETALKSLTDTFSYVGSMGQKVKTLEQELDAAKQQAVTPELATTVKELQTQLRDTTFYANNPQFNTPEAKALITKFGGNPEEVVNDEVFKNAFGAIQKTAEMDGNKSVVHTNPRLGVVQDNMTKAVEALKTNNAIGAADAATAAVIEAFDLK